GRRTPREQALWPGSREQPEAGESVQCASSARSASCRSSRKPTAEHCDRTHLVRMIIAIVARLLECAGKPSTPPDSCSGIPCRVQEYSDAPQAQDAQPAWPRDLGTLAAFLTDAVQKPAESADTEKQAMSLPAPLGLPARIAVHFRLQQA